jgi:hypothetical protein
MNDASDSIYSPENMRWKSDELCRFHLGLTSTIAVHDKSGGNWILLVHRGKELGDTVYLSGFKERPEKSDTRIKISARPRYFPQCLLCAYLIYTSIRCRGDLNPSFCEHCPIDILKRGVLLVASDWNTANCMILETMRYNPMARRWCVSAYERSDLDRNH